VNLPLFIAKKIYSSNDTGTKVSRPAIRIATAGVAIGLAVMIITVSVVIGFKHTIRDKVVGFGSHIKIENFLNIQNTDSHPVCIDDSMMKVLTEIDGVARVERYAITQGILKTENDFLGISFKGVGQEYDTTFLHNSLVDGKIPTFSDNKNSGSLLISRITADKLRLNVGSKVFAYFISDNDIRVRKFTITGIYDTGMTQFDNSLCLTDIYTTIRLNKWQTDMCSGAELQVTNFEQLEKTAQCVENVVNRTVDRYCETLTSQTVYEAYPQIFSWLELLDINVWIILALMTCVAGFTMISGLLIIILERTQMIGVMKALGAADSTVRHTFLWFAVFIIGQGLLWGNIIGIGLVVLQIQTGLISLDPATYYVNTAPMEINIPLILLINTATLLISITVLIGPSYLISHIHPAKSMRYE